MAKKEIFVGITLICLVFVAIGYYVYNQLVEAGFPSCVLSIEDVIRHEFERGALKGVIVTEEWQTLSEEREQGVFTEFRSTDTRFDCKQFPQFADGSALVGSNGQIRFRREGQITRVLIESDEKHARSY